MEEQERGGNRQTVVSWAKGKKLFQFKTAKRNIHALKKRCKTRQQIKKISSN